MMAGEYTCFTTESYIWTHLTISWEHPAAYSSFATKRCMNNVFKGYKMRNENLNAMQLIFIKSTQVLICTLISNIYDLHSKLSSFTYISNFKACVDKVMWWKDFFFYITICASVIFWFTLNLTIVWLQYSYLTVLIPD